ncbi:hypothetical protein SCHPADRAFT_893141 [Schizopora paradoxa]|uniref:Uncharacterized protein n=1 Tax=Schizopora paradoxa TaxID=27342 RepID=A0A0H2RBX8_9AGAM|nr:hypothetical protein SCHPADRAFT_893141 [Schizopora paradoxa]
MKHKDEEAFEDRRFQSWTRYAGDNAKISSSAFIGRWGSELRLEVVSSESRVFQRHSLRQLAVNTPELEGRRYEDEVRDRGVANQLSFSRNIGKASKTSVSPFGQDGVVYPSLSSMSCALRPLIHPSFGRLETQIPTAQSIRRPPVSESIEWKAISLSQLSVDGDKPYNRSMVQIRVVFAEAGNRGESGAGNSEKKTYKFPLSFFSGSMINVFPNMNPDRRIQKQKPRAQLAEAGHSHKSQEGSSASSAPLCINQVFQSYTQGFR